jgi:hypothetical protein
VNASQHPTIVRHQVQRPIEVEADPRGFGRSVHGSKDGNRRRTRDGQ